MCYTGSCPYEYKSGDGAGECSLSDKEPVPDDAECVLMDRWIDEWERMHPICTLYLRARSEVMLSSVQDEIQF